MNVDQATRASWTRVLRRTGTRAGVVLAFATCAQLAVAQQPASEPLWELGLGVSALHLPDYRGSDETRTYAFPLPFFVYRGERLRADRDGLRGVLFDSDRVHLELSVSASVPVDSDRNDARSGMPDLDPTLEIGPLASVTLLRSSDRRMKLDLRLPLRGGITIDGSPRDTGWVFSPNINLDLEDLGGGDGVRGWNLGLLAGPVFASARQHKYFYEVRPEYARADRPAYSPGGGFSGAQALAALTRRYPHFWVGGFVRYDRLDGARFEDSPLVRKRSGVFAGVGVAWILGESTTRVPAAR